MTRSPGYSFYPIGPSAAPLRAATLGYKLRVVLVLASLLLFVAFYLGLLAGAGWLVYWSVAEAPWFRGKGVILNLGMIAGLVMLFLFLLKGLFHSRRFSSEGLVEVTEEDQPRLFEFLRALCRDAGSALPGRVYLSHEVNAAVSYPRSLLSLVWPIRKNLVIGLGLVSALDLSELKGVLAHELGHFSQASMKLGQYVYVANGVVADLVFGRDRWDRALREWKGVDLRLSFPAWILSGVVWLLRKLLELAFRGINLANVSLSRQMEFDADLHAVRLSGSDALISGLWKAERAALAYRHAIHNLASIAEHGKFTNDVFHHVERSLSTLDARLGKMPEMREALGPVLVQYERGPKLHFTEPVERVSTLWETHPPNHEREANAKRVYVSAPADTRPAWSLFVKEKELRERLTAAVYAQMGVEPRRLSPAAEIAELIEEESGEMRQADHYHGLYENRVVCPGDVDALAREVDEGLIEGSIDAEALREAAAAFTGDALKEMVDRLNDLRGQQELLQALAQGRAKLKAKTAMFRGEQRTREQMLGQREEVERELAEATEALKEADRAFFRHFYVCAALDPLVLDELLKRYRFLLDLQGLIVKLTSLESPIEAAVAKLRPGEGLSEQEFQYVRGVFGEARATLARVMKRVRSLDPPRLALLDQGTPLHEFVLAGKVVERLEGDALEGQWIGALLDQFSGALRRLRKLHFKNLGQLLALTERLDPTLFPEAGGQDDGGGGEPDGAREG